ncbi:DNA polymerase III subunit beta, partial [Patescibacteria group bacterium]|nr:DNA polymerase III subunit beta [Patescibacteria group bacterium]
KLTILQEKLKEGLKVVTRASFKSLSLPILNNILLQTEKNFINLSATDLEIGIRWWSLSKIEKEGKIVIPTQVFSGFINSLPNKKVNLEINKLDLNIDCENYKTKLKGYSADDFPIIPQITEGEIISIDSDVFCQGLNQVVGIASPSNTRPEISGIYMIFENNTIKMVATDSFRLGEKVLSIEKVNLRQSYSLILPQKAAKEIINIFGEKKEELKIYLTPNQILFETLMSEVSSHPQIHLISRLIEGEYPNYQEIIPDKHKVDFIVNKEEFLNQIKTASIFSGKVNEIKLKVDPENQKVTVLSKSPDLGEYTSFFSAKIKGKEITASFNFRFLLEGLLNIKSSQVIFELSGEEGPGVLRPTGDKSYLYIVMPIKAS